MIISIHQPNYIPWLQFFDKINQADKFVFLDSVEISRGKFINRNRIKTVQGSLMLTIPISTRTTKINSTKIANKRMQLKHFKTIKMNYSKSKYFKLYEEKLGEIYGSNWDNIAEFNLAIIKLLLKEFKIETPLYRSSELNAEGGKSTRIIEICKKLDGKIYYSGTGADYMDKDLFEKNNLEIIYQSFNHPSYKQLYGEFTPNLSALDFLFNVGPDKAAEFFRKTKK